MSNSTPANEFVTDTMALVLRLEQRKLGMTGKAIFEAVESGKAMLYVPAVVLAEILYLSEKHRIITSLQEVGNYLQKFPNCQEYPLNFVVMQSASEITDIPELHDRLIAATSRFLKLELLTNDPVIQDSQFAKTVW